MSRISTLSYSIISLVGLALLLVGISTFAQPATTSAPINTGTSPQNTSNLGVKLEATGPFDFAVLGSSEVRSAPIFSAGNMVFDGNVVQGDIDPSSINQTLTIRGDLFAGAPIQIQDGFILNEFLREPMSSGFTDSEPVCANQEGELVRCIEGCTHPLASNFNPQANEDDGTCDIAYGCTNPVAANYDSDAVMDDGSCEAGTLTRAVCYYTDPQSNATSISRLNPDDCIECQGDSFFGPDNAIDNKLTKYIVGPGGSGGPFTQGLHGSPLYPTTVLNLYNAFGDQSAGAWDMFPYLSFNAYNAGMGGSSDNPFNVGRWTSVVRAGDAGGPGMVRTVEGLSFSPTEEFNILFENGPTQSSQPSLSAAVQFTSITGQNGFTVPLADDFNALPSSVFSLFTPEFIGADNEQYGSTTVFKQGGGQVSATGGTAASSPSLHDYDLTHLHYDSYVNNPSIVHTSSSGPHAVPLFNACRAIYAGHTASLTSQHTSVDNWDYDTIWQSDLHPGLLPSEGISSQVAVRNCSFKDMYKWSWYDSNHGIDVCPWSFGGSSDCPTLEEYRNAMSTEWLSSPWRLMDYTAETTHVSPVINPGNSITIDLPNHLAALIPYTPGRGGRGGYYTTSLGVVGPEPGNPGAVCFEWQEELDL